MPWYDDDFLECVCEKEDERLDFFVSSLKDTVSTINSLPSTIRFSKESLEDMEHEDTINGILTALSDIECCFIDLISLIENKKSS